MNENYPNDERREWENQARGGERGEGRQRWGEGDGPGRAGSEGQYGWDNRQASSGHGLRNRDSFGEPDRSMREQDYNPGYRDQDYGMGQRDFDRDYGNRNFSGRGYNQDVDDADRGYGRRWGHGTRPYGDEGDQRFRNYDQDYDGGRFGQSSGRERWGGPSYDQLYGSRDRGRHLFGEQGAGAGRGRRREEYDPSRSSEGNRHYPGLADRYTGGGAAGEGGRQWGAFGGAGWGMSGTSNDTGYWEGTLAQHHHHRGRGPRGYERSDERIKEDICERLTDDPRIDASDIAIECRAGVVTLEGTIDQRWLKHRVEDMVASCSGVKDVQNRLAVKESQPRNGSDSRAGGEAPTRVKGEQPGASTSIQ